MAFRQYLDGGGHPMKLLEWDGHFFVSRRPVDNWHQVTAMTSRDQDVLLCGYPKSGLHWLWEVVTMLKTGSTQLSSARMETHGFLMASKGPHLDSLPCPRVLTTHRRFHDLPSDFVVKRRKIVCVLREPKDVCVSYYHMLRALRSAEYEGTFQGFVPLFLAGHVPLGSWAGWVLSFEKGLKEHPELSVHVVHYEQLKADPVGEIRRLARYLECPETLAEDIARQTQFAPMKTFKDTLHNPYAQAYKDNVDPIFRKGQPDEWQEYFSTEEAEQFDAQLRTHLGRPIARASL